jgi:hypothetical protein
MSNVRFPAGAVVGLGLLCTLVPSSLPAADIYFVEDFANAPALSGWQTFGNSNLFAWNPANHNLEVTWNSAQPNSYFFHPLGAVMTRTNDFLFGFDLRLADVAIGTTPGAPYTFELAVGLLDYASATNAGFLRGTGFSSPNLVEFDFFPDSGYGASVSTPIVSRSNEWSGGGFTFPLGLTTGDVYHVEMRFVASSQSLITRMTRNGQPFGPVQGASLAPAPAFSDFQVDQIAVSSYSDAGQDPMYAGSILAHGTVANVFFMSPPPVADIHGGFSGQVWQMQFDSRTNWLYTLERTTDFQSWAAVSPTVAGTGSPLSLQDANPAADRAWYRVKATKE